MSKYILPLLLATAFSVHAMEVGKRVEGENDPQKEKDRNDSIRYTVLYNKYYKEISALRFNEDTRYLTSLRTDLNSNKETEYACFIEKKELGNYTYDYEIERTPKKDIINILRQKTAQYREITNV